MHEPLPLATIHEAVLTFLRGRSDVVVFGATAVNAYVSEPRMTQDIDLMSTRAAELAEELRVRLGAQFHIAVRLRVIGDGRGYRLFQIQQPSNRHLVDVRSVRALPESRTIEDIRVSTPADLIAQKVLSYHSRRGQPKGFSDRRDLASLFLRFPELKREAGEAAEALKALGASAEEFNTWRQIVSEEIPQPDEDAEFD